MSAQKAIPVVLRQRGDIEILAFVHPGAGRQIVKGSIGEGETAEAAALRELAEEAGVTGARTSGRYGSQEIEGETWHFVRVAPPDLPENWVFRTEDDGGHIFRFFWHPLSQGTDGNWHPKFRQALDFVRASVS